MGKDTRAKYILYGDRYEPIPVDAEDAELALLYVKEGKTIQDIVRLFDGLPGYESVFSRYNLFHAAKQMQEFERQ